MTWHYLSWNCVQFCASRIGTRFELHIIAYWHAVWTAHYDTWHALCLCQSAKPCAIQTICQRKCVQPCVIIIMPRNCVKLFTFFLTIARECISHGCIPLHRWSHNCTLLRDIAIIWLINKLLLTIHQYIILQYYLTVSLDVLTWPQIQLWLHYRLTVRTSRNKRSPLSGRGRKWLITELMKTFA